MKHNLNLFGVPTPSARWTDPSTSHQAAESIDSDCLRSSQRQVLHALQGIGSGSDDDIYNALCANGVVMSPSGARTRRNELVAMGHVKDSGDRVRLASGRLSIVWEVAR